MNILSCGWLPLANGFPESLIWMIVGVAWLVLQALAKSAKKPGRRSPSQESAPAAPEPDPGAVQHRQSLEDMLRGLTEQARRTAEPSVPPTPSVSRPRPRPTISSPVPQKAGVPHSMPASPAKVGKRSGPPAGALPRPVLEDAYSMVRKTDAKMSFFPHLGLPKIGAQSTRATGLQQTLRGPAALSRSVLVHDVLRAPRCYDC